MGPGAKVDSGRDGAEALALKLTHVVECLPELVEGAARDDLALIRITPCPAR